MVAEPSALPLKPVHVAAVIDWVVVNVAEKLTESKKFPMLWFPVEVEMVTNINRVTVCPAGTE